VSIGQIVIIRLTVDFGLTKKTNLNKLLIKIKCGCLCKLYADDRKLYTSVSTVVELENL